jgi:hypothetical protein
MKDASEDQTTCPQCGRRHPAAAGACPACGATGAAVDKTVQDASSAWTRTRDSLKIKWVAAVIAFWVSAAILGVVFFLQGKLNLILTSVSLGMLIIGMWLKTRYQLHLRNDPNKR